MMLWYISLLNGQCDVREGMFINTSSENDRGSLDPTLEANKKTVMAYARLSCQDRDQGAARKALGSPLSQWSDRPADRPPVRFQHGLGT
jgi:hypothetical protein